MVEFNAYICVLMCIRIHFLASLFLEIFVIDTYQILKEIIVLRKFVFCPGITIKKVSCNFSWETLLYYQPKEEICSDLSRCDSACLVWCLGNCFMIFFFFLPHDIFEKSNTYIHVSTHTIFSFIVLHLENYCETIFRNLKRSS